MAQLLFQVTDVRERALSRARFVHSTDEAEEHAALDDGRGSDHAFGVGVLRLIGGLADGLQLRRGASSAVFFCAELRAGSAGLVFALQQNFQIVWVNGAEQRVFAVNETLAYEPYEGFLP